jgi:hypothetical protein
MARRWIVLALVLVIAAALAGCGGGSSDPPPPTGSPARAIPPSTLRPATTLLSGLPRQVGTDGDFQVFEVTAAQAAARSSTGCSATADRTRTWPLDCRGRRWRAQGESACKPATGRWVASSPPGGAQPC